MHLLAATSGTLDDAASAIDLKQEPGDIVILSSADSELAALARAADQLPEGFGFQLLVAGSVLGKLGHFPAHFFKFRINPVNSGAVFRRVLLFQKRPAFAQDLSLDRQLNPPQEKGAEDQKPEKD